VNNKDEILADFEDIDKKQNSNSGAETTTDNNEGVRQIGDWHSKTQGSVEQGVASMPLGITTSLKQLTFQVESKSDYWRAGFKLEDPNAEIFLPRLLTPQSFLFHVARNLDSTYETSAYIDGDANSAKHKRQIPLDTSKPIKVAIDRNDKNFIRCYINEELVYTGELPSAYFQKVYLVIWGDEHQAEVDIIDIELVEE